MRCKDECLKIVPTWCGVTETERMERPRAFSVNSPPSSLWKSSYREDSISSDFSKSSTEAGFIYAYSSQTLLTKAKSLKKTNGLINDASSFMKSQDTKDSSTVSVDHLCSRSKLKTILGSSTTSLSSEQGKDEPKVMKYVKDSSILFESLALVPVNFNCSNDVTFYKGVHELDGQTYILKKIRIFMKNNEDIKSHPSYNEILKVKDNSLPVDILYVNSWIELSQNQNSESSEEGLFVEICIQMRYTNKKVKLVKDLMIWSQNPSKNFDEDTTYDLAEDI